MENKLFCIIVLSETITCSPSHRIALQVCFW